MDIKEVSKAFNKLAEAAKKAAQGFFIVIEKGAERDGVKLPKPTNARKAKKRRKKAMDWLHKRCKKYGQ